MALAVFFVTASVAGWHHSSFQEPRALAQFRNGIGDGGVLDSITDTVSDVKDDIDSVIDNITEGSVGSGDIINNITSEEDVANRIRNLSTSDWTQNASQNFQSLRENWFVLRNEFVEKHQTAINERIANLDTSLGGNFEELEERMNSARSRFGLEVSVREKIEQLTILYEETGGIQAKVNEKLTSDKKPYQVIEQHFPVEPAQGEKKDQLMVKFHQIAIDFNL